MSLTNEFFTTKNAKDTKDTENYDSKLRALRALRGDTRGSTMFRASVRSLQLRDFQQEAISG